MPYLSSSQTEMATHEAFSTSREVAELLKSGRGHGIGSDRTMPKVWLIGRRHNDEEQGRRRQKFLSLLPPSSPSARQ